MRKLLPLLVVACAEGTGILPTPRIIGGIQVNPPEKYPFLVSLQSFSSHICGGSLIDPQWVLTAAHCISASRPASTYRVLVHGHNLHVRSHRCTETISIVRTLCHPSYSSNTMVADICLLQLQRPATCGAELRARGALAHLDSTGTGFAAPGNMLTVAGWGRTDYGPYSTPGVPRYPSVSREANIPIISNTQCTQQYGWGQIRSDMLCAGAAGVDSCSGDSGGPLFTVVDGRAYQVVAPLTQTLRHAEPH